MLLIEKGDAFMVQRLSSYRMNMMTPVQILDKTSRISHIKIMETSLGEGKLWIQTC